MKQLNTYFEGLLNKSDKTDTNSSIEAYAIDYIEEDIKTWSANLSMTYTISNKTITFANGSTFSDDNLNKLVNEFGFKKIIFQGNWCIRTNGRKNIYDLPVTIECNKNLDIGLSYITKEEGVFENMHIKAKCVNINGKVKLRKSQIWTDSVQVNYPDQITGCEIQSKQIVLRLSKDKRTISLVGKTMVPTLTSSKFTKLMDNTLLDQEKVEIIKDIDPSIVLKFDKYGIDDIIIKYTSGRNSIVALVFTKKPDLYISKFPSTYEMKNGWYAIWVDSNDPKIKIKS
jgi:hypothetical protein